ncbi:MAG: ATP-binding protein, partial [Oscillospiraceae bacterium]|nr:ATP-binding protein [Oscillospiraceae bacterium]
RGMGLLISTHDVDFAWRWADRILLFHEGKLAADGAPETIFRDLPLLETCGLEQPLLCQAGLLLGLEKLPRTVSELKP